MTTWASVSGCVLDSMKVSQKLAETSTRSKVTPTVMTSTGSVKETELSEMSKGWRWWVLVLVTTLETRWVEWKGAMSQD
jgi:hypothetical protein